jgi:molybdopterin molybdotransferase
VPVTLRLTGYVPAGGRHNGLVGPGEAVRIFTGARVPDGADAVVIQEDTEAIDGAVGILEAARLNRHIRRAGLDFTEGQVVIPAGTRLSARHVGLASAVNRPWLKVHRRPRVAILPTGDEVALPGEPIGPNQIVSSNGAALAAMVRAAGGVPVQLGIAPDDETALMAMAAGAAGSDLLLTSGGASVGEHDLVQKALGASGLQVDFWKIAMRPGKPLMFGRLGATPVLGLPGNPVSSVICSLLFLIPALERLQGLPGRGPVTEPAIAVAPLPLNDHRQDYLRATFARDAAGRLLATPWTRQDSSMTLALAASDGLIMRPPHAAAVETGDSVDVIRFPGGAELM